MMDTAHFGRIMRERRERSQISLSSATRKSLKLSILEMWLRIISIIQIKLLSFEIILCWRDIIK